MKIVNASEGATITLQDGETPNNTKILWFYGVHLPHIQIASMSVTEVRSDYQERFRGRLKLNSWTGALTITHLRVSDSGVYMWLCEDPVSGRSFKLRIYSLLSTPSITVNPSFSNSTFSSVTVECSMNNSQELILSWYNGAKPLNKTSSSVLPSRLSVTLEIESHSKGNYSCVAENPVEKLVIKLKKDGIHMRNEEASGWCQTQTAVRLVISAAIGLLLTVLVIDHIRLRR